MASLDVRAAAAHLRCQVGGAASLGGSGGVEAELRPHPSQDRFYVRVDPTPPDGWGETPAAVKPALARQRFRFRVCHELGHALKFDRRPGRGPTRSVPWNRSEETWCDEFARALLVPPRAAAKLEPTAQGAFDLQARFDVSLEVALRALIAAHPDSEAVLWFWPEDEPALPKSLICQWTSVEGEVSLGPWLKSKPVALALSEGAASGRVPGLRPRAAGWEASVRSAAQRRQLVLVASRA